MELPLWFDEVSLALSWVLDDYSPTKVLYLPLAANQKCPPLFVFFTYLITNIAGLKIYTIRLIPFLSGIVSNKACNFS